MKLSMVEGSRFRGAAVLISCLGAIGAAACGGEPGQGSVAEEGVPSGQSAASAASPGKAGAPSLEQVTQVFDAAAAKFPGGKGTSAVVADTARAGSGVQVGSVSEALDSIGTTNITGSKLGLFFNFEDKDAAAPTDHTVPTSFIPDPNVQNQLNTPLSTMFDNFWSGAPAGGGQSQHDIAVAAVIKQISDSVAGIGDGAHAYNISASIPTKGTLNASIQKSIITLTYSLPHATFGFTSTTSETGSVLGLFTIPDPKFTGSADLSLTVMIPIPQTPCNLVPTATATVSNANISAANWTATAIQIAGGVANFIQNKPLNIFADAQNQIDQTTTENIGAFSSTLNALAPACTVAVSDGFTQFDAFINTSNKSLNFRLTEPIPPALAPYSFNGPTFTNATLSPSQPEAQAGSQVGVTGAQFPVNDSTSLGWGWTDTITSGLVETDIQWGSIFDIFGNTVHNVVVTRTDGDGKNTFSETNLTPNTPYFFRVRDCSTSAIQLGAQTCTPWSNLLGVSTNQAVTTTEVDLFLTYGGSNHQVGTGTIGADGTFTTTITVPADAPTGTDPLVAQVAGQTIATSSLAVVAAGQPLQPIIVFVDDNGNIETPPNIIFLGGAAHVHGQGFEPNSTVTLYADSTSGQVLATAMTDGNGAFTTDVAPTTDSTEAIVAAETVNGQTEEASIPVIVEVLK